MLHWFIPLTLLPMSAKTSRVSLPMAPAVSITTATKWCVQAKSRYVLCFLPLLCQCCYSPCLPVVWARCDAAKVSVHVASQTRVHPDFQGMIVTPLGKYIYIYIYIYIYMHMHTHSHHMHTHTHTHNHHHIQEAHTQQAPPCLAELAGRYWLHD